MPGYSGGALAGFFLGVLSILSWGKIGTMALVLAVPIVDAMYSIIRRIAAGKSPLKGDAGHFHHRLLEVGWGKRRIAVFYIIVSAIFGMVASVSYTHLGRGQYGHCFLKLEPLGRGEGFEFANAIKGGSIPSEFIPSVEKGVREALEKGVLLGYVMTDLKITLYDGTFHDVDSSDMAFKIAGSIGLQEGAKKAGMNLLEPIMKPVSYTHLDVYKRQGSY